MKYNVPVDGKIPLEAIPHACNAACPVSASGQCSTNQQTLLSILLLPDHLHVIPENVKINTCTLPLVYVWSIRVLYKTMLDVPFSSLEASAGIISDSQRLSTNSFGWTANSQIPQPFTDYTSGFFFTSWRLFFLCGDKMEAKRQKHSEERVTGGKKGGKSEKAMKDRRIPGEGRKWTYKRKKTSKVRPWRNDLAVEGEEYKKLQNKLTRPT